MIYTNDKEYSHIILAITISFLMFAMAAALRLAVLITEGYPERIPVFLLIAAAVFIMMAATVVIDKEHKHSAFLLPCFMTLGLFLYTFLTGGIPYLFGILAGFCIASSLYLNLNAYAKYLLFINLLLFVYTFVLQHPAPVEDVYVDSLRVQWGIMALPMLISYGILRNIVRQRANSRVILDYFRVNLAITPNILAIVDESDRIVIISDEFVKLANIKSAEYAIGRPLFDLLPENMHDMISDVMDSETNHECIVTNKEQYFKILFLKLEGSIKGSLIDISDVTSIMRASDLAKKASESKSRFLSKMSHEIRTPMNAILGMSELILRGNISDEAREQVLTIRQSGRHLLSIINDILDFSKIESGKMRIVNNKYHFSSTIADIISITKMHINTPELHFAVYIQKDIPDELFGDEVRLRQVLINVLSNAVKYTPSGHVTLDAFWENAADDISLLTIKIKDTGIGIKPEDMGDLFGEFNQFDVEKNRNIEGTGLGLAITYNLVKLMDGNIEVSSEYGAGTEFTVTLPQKLLNETVQKTSVPSFEGKKALVYGRTPLYMEYTGRALKDLSIDFHITYDCIGLPEKILEETWDFIFVEEELIYVVRYLVESCNSNIQVVMMTNAIDRQDFSALIMPVHLFSIVNALTSENRMFCAKSQNSENFIAPDASVLVVDDIDINLMVAEGMLRPYEVNITLCHSGSEAIKSVKSKDYDLVFMDHMMPEMSGIETVEFIRGIDNGTRHNAKYASLPIVALTANAIVGAREMFIQNGFNDFLSKPIEPSKLNSILTKWLPKEKQKPINYTSYNIHENEAAIAIEESNINIEDVNVSKGMFFSGGGIKNYLDTLAVFHKDFIAKIDELANCFEAKDLSLYTTHVHALKAACANIGADKLSEQAKLLEAASLENNREFIEKHNEHFIEALIKLLDNIQKVVSANMEEPVNNFDISTLKKYVIKLKGALHSFDMLVIDEITEVLQSAAPLPDADEALKDILENVFIGQYEQAIVNIDEFVENLKGA